ncbi:hypothetical protein BDV96DRAFT_598079 [Lophiotrema nucula]|uniref:Uncharacterized protein n=1 Tax=Lophiotrema nucula TaxID=690887 RepID=A0A6A5ZFK8_9PLEO|nr:hypothetical protein BDV96DRAFT_598079 [Lophiotrema nucula]
MPKYLGSRKGKCGIGYAVPVCPREVEPSPKNLSILRSYNTSILSPNGFLVTRLKCQQPRPSTAQNLPTFYQNIEEALDIRCESRSLYTIVQNHWLTSDAVDFCSGNILSLNSSGALRNEFLTELDRHPNFTTRSSGVRLIDGNYPYLEQTEQEITAFHGAKISLIIRSAFKANVAV